MVTLYEMDFDAFERKSLVNFKILHLLCKSFSFKYRFQFISIINDLVEIDTRLSYNYVIVSGFIGTHLIKKGSFYFRLLFNYTHR